MRLNAFIVQANAAAQFDRCPKTSSAWLELFQPQCAAAKPMLACQLMQAFNGGMAAWRHGGMAAWRLANNPLLRNAPSTLKRRYKRSRNNSSKSLFYSSNRVMAERNLAYQLWHRNRRRRLMWRRRQQLPRQGRVSGIPDGEGNFL
jgi:hypothetical protein